LNKRSVSVGKEKARDSQAKNAKETTTKHWEKVNNSIIEEVDDRRERKRVR